MTSEEKQAAGWWDIETCERAQYIIDSRGKRIAELEAEVARKQVTIDSRGDLNRKQSERISELGKRIADLKEKLRWAVEVVKATKSMAETCQEERDAGNGGCGACSICCGESTKRAETAEIEFQMSESAISKYQDDSAFYKAERDKLREACEEFFAARKRYDEHSAEMLAHTNDPAYWRRKAIENQNKPRLPDVSDAIRMIEAALVKGDEE